MTRLSFLTFSISLLTVQLGACDLSNGSTPNDLSLDDGPSDGDDVGGPSSPRAGSDAQLPRVGDRTDAGTVTGVQTVNGGVGCHSVTIEHAPIWSCSSEQIAAAMGAGKSVSVATPIAADTSPALRVADCADLAALRRPALKSAQLATLEGQRRQLLTKCLPTREVRYLNDQGEPQVSCGRSFGKADAGVGRTSSAPSAAGDTEGAQEYSTTNTQVTDVDEADFVKNDSGYVYVLSKAGLHVIDAWPAADTHQVAQLSISGEPTRLFLAGNKLVVYARSGGGSNGGPSAARGCTYGYDCRSQAEPGSTKVSVFDVSTPAMPRELGSYEFSGGYVDSRRIGDVVYTVVADQGVSGAPGADLSLAVTDPAQLETTYQQKVQQANALVDGLANEFFLPWVRVKTPQLEQAVPVACDGGLVAQAAGGTSFTSLVSFDLTNLGTPQRELVATKPGFVYASSTALYIATDGQNGADLGYAVRGDSSEKSTIHKFALDGLATPYRGSTLIPGHVLNQFSMDERDSVLRVATSSGWVPSPGVSSNIVNLTEQDGALRVVGQLNNLAPQEDIRSVRFDGDRGFVVTFKKTDPLFVIDLANPLTPRVLGELKIPGFSTYMHPMDRDHVLAIGFDADDQGSFAYFNGIQLQIFDVSELNNPKLQHKTVIGTRGSASDALTNHLAFNYFAPKGLLALPMTVCDGGGNGRYADKLTFSGLMVFDVSLSAGIKERGRMPFVDTASVASTVPSCSAWWTQSTSAVKRSIIMDDFVIGLSDSLYQVAGLSKLDTVLKSLPLGP
ncbi:MAG: hypothetical protein RLZZ450_614 [Pseudomonadota bacterium]|jgi:uncharacterized secreted protein with C-terminal beta-propeller domain